jgi:TRAP-type C4-dicarboxylate transport system permease small subunit
VEVLRRIDRRLGDALCFVAGIAMLWMMAQVTADAVLRYAFDSPLDATVEIVSAYPMVAVVFLPLAYVSRVGAHIEVTLFTRTLSPRALRALDSAVGLLVLATLVLLIVYTTDEAVFRTDQGEIRDAGNILVSVWPSRWLLPLGCAAMALHVIVAIGGPHRAPPPP